MVPRRPPSPAAARGADLAAPADELCAALQAAHRRYRDDGALVPGDIESIAAAARLLQGRVEQLRALPATEVPLDEAVGARESVADAARLAGELVARLHAA